MQLWFWMTPIIYLSSMIEDRYPILLTYNPFYYFVKIYQNIFLYAKLPSFEDMFIAFILSITLITVAGYLYKKMVATIKDVI